MKIRYRVLSSLICTALFVTTFSLAPGVFAADQPKSEAPSTETTEIAPASHTDADNISTETKEDNQKTVVPFTVTAIQTSGGTVSVSKASATSGEVTVTVRPSKGYGIASLLINGSSVGATYSYTFKPVKNTTVKASFRKSSSYVFIMLDAGHYGKRNRSPVLKSYYESEMNWPLHLYLKKELEKYKNVVVDTTRASQTKDREVYYRGKAAAGYDLFLSIHSNASSSKSVDYPLIITQKGQTKNSLAISLGETIESMMKTKQGYRTWQRLNKDKKTEYYGVLRGSKAVGTRGMIIEHSFHTNLRATKWLSSSTNLKKMAKAEAADIAAYYGLTKTASDAIKPSKPSVSVRGSGYNALTLKWKKSIGATGYEIYRRSGKKGTYKKIKTITKGTTCSYKNSKLKTGSTYYYRIKPYRVSGSTKRYGSYSSTKAGTVKPSAPSVYSRAGRRAVTVKWKKVTGASGYAVYRASKKRGSYKRIATKKSSSRSYTNRRLKKGKACYYKVRAYRTVKGKRIYSNYSKYTAKRAK